MKQSKIKVINDLLEAQIECCELIMKNAISFKSKRIKTQAEKFYFQLELEKILLTNQN